MIDLVRSGRSAESLGREFERTAQTIRNWLEQADIDDGLRSDGLLAAERDELRQLRGENKRLREEREILEKAAAWFAQRGTGSKRKRRSSS
jgi:transposase